MKSIALLLAVVAELCAQGLDPAALLKPPTDTWPTYNGDYSGRRYSTLAQIDRSNVQSLSLAWAFQTRSSTLKSTPLEVNGILYLTAPDQVWAIDAHTAGASGTTTVLRKAITLASAASRCTRTACISALPMHT